MKNEVASVVKFKSENMSYIEHNRINIFGVLERVNKEKKGKKNKKKKHF